MQTAVCSTLEGQQQPRLQPVQAAVLSAALRTVTPAALLSNLRPTWRGFFVAFSPWFGYYFFGYRQTPARAAARTLLD